MDSDPQGSSSANTSSVPPHRTEAISAVAVSQMEAHFSERHLTYGAGEGFGRFPAQYFYALIAVLVVAGSYSLLPIWLFMGRIWLLDPLRAIGCIFPLVAFVGALAAWRRLGWEANGTLWGLPVLGLSIVLARATTSFDLGFHIHQQNASVLHPGLVFFLYGVGAVLLFGGTRLLRATIAPLCLLLCVNPVPYAYNQAVDLPLQFLSANTARHFAHLIGLRPTGQQLQMMFTPNFGMMIVPGCNGVRGSVTLGYLALIFGYMRRLRPSTLILTALGAFLMGYVLNLVRLCTLVIYYRIGMTHESIQPYGAGVDYAIGCTLFLFATLGVGLFIRWIEPKTEEKKPSNDSAYTFTMFGYGQAARIGGFLILTLIFIVPAIADRTPLRVGVPDEQALLKSFPAQVGAYKLTRTYSEYGGNGIVQFALGDYATSPDSNGVSSQITLGVYAGIGMHLVASSRFAQGIRPDWIGSMDAMDGSGKKLHVHYVTTLYDDSIRRQYNAESVCYETSCTVSIQAGPNGIFIGSATLSGLFFTSNRNRLPILLRKEWVDGDGTPTATQRSQFEDEVRNFTAQLNLRNLLREDGAPM